MIIQSFKGTFQKERSIDHLLTINLKCLPYLVCSCSDTSIIGTAINVFYINDKFNII
jgi:hypothetical protein